MERLKKYKLLLLLLLLFLGVRSLTLNTHTFTPAENTIVAYRVSEPNDETIGSVHHIRNYKLFNIVVIVSYEFQDSTIPSITMHSYDDVIFYEWNNNSRTTVTYKWTVNWR